MTRRLLAPATADLPGLGGDMSASAPKLVRPPDSGVRLSVADWIAKGKGPTAYRPERAEGRMSKASVERARREMDGLAERGAWKEARPVHLVALYAWLHREVYGVEAVDLDVRAYAAASAMASRQLKEHHGGEPERAVEFLRWTWVREREREDWRRQNGRDAGRIGWRLQFGTALLTDYRLSLARRSGP